MRTRFTRFEDSFGILRGRIFNSGWNNLRKVPRFFLSKCMKICTVGAGEGHDIYVAPLRSLERPQFKSSAIDELTYWSVGGHARLRWVEGGFTQAQPRLTWLTWLLKPGLFMVGLTGWTVKVPRHVYFEVHSFHPHCFPLTPASR